MFGSSLPPYLCYLCLFGHSGVHGILCCALGFLFSSSCVPYVDSFSRLSIFDCPFGDLQRLFILNSGLSKLSPYNTAGIELVAYFDIP